MVVVVVVEKIFVAVVIDEVGVGKVVATLIIVLDVDIKVGNED